MVAACRRFNPRPPRGGRRIHFVIYRLNRLFQSTPPAWGATPLAHDSALYLMLFQSTPPAWGATADSVYVQGY